MRIVINGGNNTAEYLSRIMLEARHRVTIIEQDLEVVDHLAGVLDPRVTIVQGDGCDSDTQRDAGMGDTDLFISLTGHDEVNLVACELAMVNFDVPRCIANVSSPKNMSIFREVGIESVSSTELIARMVEEEAVIGDMRTVFSLREGDIVMTEVKLPTKMRQPEGVMVRDLPLPREIQLIAVIRDGEFVMTDGDTLLMPGETIIAASKTDAEENFRSIIRKL